MKKWQRHSLIAFSFMLVICYFLLGTTSFAINPSFTETLLTYFYYLLTVGAPVTFICGVISYFFNKASK